MSDAGDSGWSLHPRLAADTHRVLSWPLCELLLMDDARYPWLVLVPRVPGAAELIDLDDASRAQAWREIDAASRLLQALCEPDKLNIAALGNVVSQLHVHVIARFRGDDAWPRPVWGVHPASPYAPAARDALQQRLRAQGTP